MDKPTLNQLRRRILQISYDRKLSHLGSCLTALPIIVEIYEQKHPTEKFILSAGHAHLAHLVVMEHLGQVNAEEMVDKYGIHCERNAGCDCSTGSLGQGLPIAVGMALAKRSKNVYCLISDGECAEGSIHEAMRIKNGQNLGNLKVYINVNGWGAYQPSNQGWIYHNYEYLADIRETEPELPFLKGQDAHYHVMNEDDYETAIKILA